MRTPNGLRLDSPAWPLLLTHVSYWGISSGAGAADGTTIVCANLANEPSYLGHAVKVLDGAAAGQTRWIVNDTSVAGTAVVDSPFTDNAGAVAQIVAGTRFVIISVFKDEALYYGTTTAAGLADGSTMVDAGLATPFTVDDECIGHTVRILTSGTGSLIGQEREIHDYDVGATVLYFATVFTAQVPIATTYVVLRNRPSSGGGGPQPEPETEETAWKLADFDNFDVADPTADTERWSSEYISAGAADGLADINTTVLNRLYLDITAAVVAAAEYGVRRLQLNVGNRWFTKADFYTTVTNPNANFVWAGLSISAGAAWDANNYIRIYKRQDNVPVEGIAVEYNIAGAGAVIVPVLATTQDDVAFKLERLGNIWRCYYSLSNAPHHHWILGAEIEDPTNALTDDTSTYISVYNPEDAAGQQITASVDKWEYYVTLGTLENILTLLNIRGGALAYLGYCSPVMGASPTVILCPNLRGFGNDWPNTGYQMSVLRNTNGLATPPEMETRDIVDYVSATGTFTTEAFSANVEANDIVLVIHNSVAIKVIGQGVLDTSSTTVPADSTRPGLYAWENNEFFKGCLLMPIAGNCRFQPRPIRSYTAATGVFTLDEPFSQLPGAVRYLIISSDYPVQRLLDIFNLVNAMLVTSETGGTLTTTGGVQDVYINNAPAGVYEPLVVQIDFTGMTAAETIVLQELYRVRPGALFILKDTLTFVGAQAVPLKNVELEPNRYGVEVTLHCTVGGPIDVPWEVIYRV